MRRKPKRVPPAEPEPAPRREAGKETAVRGKRPVTAAGDGAVKTVTVHRSIRSVIKPFIRLKDSVAGILRSVGRRLGEVSPEEWAAEHRQARAGEREERRARKVMRGRRRRDALAERSASVGEGLSSLARRIAGRTGEVVVAALLFIPRKAVALAALAYERFPLGLVETGIGEETPPLLEKWKTLALITVGGAFLWVLSVLVVRDRWTLCGCVVGLVVGVGFIRTLDGMLTRETGLFAATATVLSVIVGELVVLLLFRMRIFKNIGITEKVMARTHTAWGFYTNFFWWFVLGILLPSAIIAFLVGAWPFPRRFYWRGAQR